jgi:hypothetical protein
VHTNAEQLPKSYKDKLDTLYTYFSMLKDNSATNTNEKITRAKIIFLCTLIAKKI